MTLAPRLRAPQTGAITFVQRFGGLINLNVDSALARTLLAALGLPCTPATFAPARAPPQAERWFANAS